MRRVMRRLAAESEQLQARAIMGLRHGAYCLGCCWILMALLFVAGVMNLFWVAVIALLVMAEKVLPKGEVLGYITGIALVAAGVARIAKL